MFGTVACFIIISIFIFSFLGFQVQLKVRVHVLQLAREYDDTVTCQKTPAATMSALRIQKQLTTLLTPPRCPNLQDCLAMGAIFAATDSVAVLQVLNRNTNPLLFSLVFGEGIVNDATSVVLLGAIARSGAAAGAVVGSFFYLLVTSMVLGGGVGLLIAFVLKRATLGAHQVGCAWACAV